jgi:octaprenyl-diphosphate synthase
MSISAEALLKIKSLAKNDLSDMDIAIKQRLLYKDQLVQNITYHIINSGGKRLRPMLLILSAKLFGYQGSRHINLAAAVEFIHTATLLHDDVVDHSDLRRGLPTANQHWDNKSSILVGDFLFSQAFMLMSEDEDLRILQILSKAAAIIAEGEVKQLSSISNLELSVENYLEIISAKTAELFAAACCSGAAIAGVNVETQAIMYNFGLNLGIGFQILDDVLDYKANQLAIGKNIGDDFKEHKVTLPVILAYKFGNSKDHAFWQRVICQANQSDEDFSYALELFAKYDIFSQCLDLADAFTYKAEEYIKNTPKNTIREVLIEILSFSTNRNF